MKYYIDQSGKIEYTSHDTVVAISNGKKSAILIKAKDKRILQRRFRDIGKKQVFIYRIFSFLVFTLLKKHKFSEVVIDTEYPGRSDLIKNFILTDFRKKGIKVSPGQISFHQIGKKCEAHWHGYYVFKKKRKPEMTITAKEVLQKLMT